MSKVNYKHRNLKDALFGLVCLANIATTDKELVDNLVGDCKREIAEYELTRKEYAQYKEIEDELGIDLVILVKAKKQGIYCLEQPGNKIIYLQPSYVGMDNFGSWHYTILTSEKLFKDYGKTWALTREELEK